MTDKNAIHLISGLLQNPPSANDAGNNPVAKYIQKYPYFIPARYIKAAHHHKKKAFSEEMLANIYPYTGNWLLLIDHLEGVAKPRVEKIVEEETVAVKETPTEPEAIKTPTGSEVTEPQVAPESEIFVPETIAEIPLPEPEIAAAVYEEPLPEPIAEAEKEPLKEEDIFTPLHSEDYFMQQGIKIPGDMPENVDELKAEPVDKRDKSLMIMMSFTEWLLHFKNTAEKMASEQEDKKAVRTMWQKEKLAAALEEENDEIPENVFEMAVNSITKEDGLASESLADIYTKQGKYDQAIEMYRKLSLRNPQKNAYFARKIEAILKDKQL